MKTKDCYVRLSLLIVMAVLAFEHAQARQELRYDDARRVFTLSYVDNSGVHRQVDIVPANHIEPMTRISVTRLPNDVWSYEYLVANLVAPLSDQPLRRFEIECPSSGGVLKVEGVNGWGGAYGFDNMRGIQFCNFHTSITKLPPGDSVRGLMIHSSFLPQIVEGRFWGLNPRTALIDAEEMPELSELYMQAVGTLGGWYTLPVVGPRRFPNELATPEIGTSIVARDLDGACDLSWIINPGVCNSLRTKLEQAGRALERGRNEAAVGQLQAFLNELEAQHGEEPGKHVNDNAYWLLKVNVEFVLERMAGR